MIQCNIYHFTGVDISLPIDTFVCPSEISCNSDERCELTYQITQDKVTIHSDQQSFVSLLAAPVEKCVCLGPKCVNPCSNNPCHRSKVSTYLYVSSLSSIVTRDIHILRELVTLL